MGVSGCGEYRCDPMPLDDPLNYPCRNPIPAFGITSPFWIRLSCTSEVCLFPSLSLLCPPSRAEVSVPNRWSGLPPDKFCRCPVFVEEYSVWVVTR